MSGMMSLSITSVMGCVLDAGFLCDKALMLRDAIKGTRVYHSTSVNSHELCNIYTHLKWAALFEVWSLW